MRPLAFGATVLAVPLVALALAAWISTRAQASCMLAAEHGASRQALTDSCRHHLERSAR